MTGLTYSELLSRFGNISVLPNNPFYILGLPASATPREIRRRREDLESVHEMGCASWGKAFPYLLKGSKVPTFANVMEAFDRLENIEYRLIASYFWFWTADGPFAGTDRAFGSFLSGNVRDAELQWSGIAHSSSVQHVQLDGGVDVLRAAAPTPGELASKAIAKHNMAVLARLKASVWEYSVFESGEELSSDDAQLLNALWIEAEDESRPSAFVAGKSTVPRGEWNTFSAGVDSLNDPRITEELMAQLRLVVKDLPVYWHAMYVCEYARKDCWQDVEAHMMLINEHLPKYALSADVLDVVFDAMRRRHRTYISRFDAKIKDNPAEGLAASNELIDSTTDDYRAICALLGEKPTEGLYKAQHKLRRMQTDPRNLFSQLEFAAAQKDVKQQERFVRLREELYDPILKACLRYMIRYSESTKDWDITIQWDDFLRGLAVSEKLKDDLKKDLLAIFRSQISELVDRHSKEVRASAQVGYEAVRHLLAESKEVLGLVGKRYGYDDAFYEELQNLVVAACRAYLVDYGNKTKNWELCLQMYAALSPMAKDEKLAELLQKDVNTLKENAREDLVRRCCWHCKKRLLSEDSYKIQMTGDVRFEYDFATSGTRRTWKVLTVNVPLCGACKIKYRASLVVTALGLWAVFSAIILALGKFDSWDVPVVLMFGCWPGLVVGCYLCRAVRKWWFSRFPDVENAIRLGYVYGKRPA